MIEIQKKYRTYLKDVVAQLQLIEIDVSLQEKLIENIRDTELIVPIVGGFSAGKSTLINSWLKEEVLSTNLTPETALATELRYSSDNYIEAVKGDGTIDRYEVNQSDAIKSNANKYQYLKLFLNNEKLKQIEPLTLVDMPGFDSPVELHNQAIMNYLTKGIYFIVLTSIEDGNITKSTIRELENITEFGKGFSFCLSKVNLRGKSDIRNVKEKIQDQLEDYFDFNQKVIEVSDTGGKELEKILTTINTENLFEKIFLDDLKFNYMENESSINTIISTLKISKEEAVEAIEELNNSINKIISKKTTMIENAKSKYSDNSVDAIVEAVSRELLSNKDNLISIAMTSSDSFSREINDIVKNTLIYEVRSHIQETSSAIVDDFSIEIKDISSSLSSFELGDKWIEVISNSTKSFLEKAQNGLDTYVENRKNNQDDKSSNLYKVITATLGITTTILNPLMEVVILFLPEIISFFSGKSQEAKQKEQISNKLISEMIPSIKSKIRTTLPEMFNQQINSIIEEISNQFEEQLRQKKQEISIAQKNKEDGIEDIEKQIGALEKSRESLKALATETLYREQK